MKDKCAFKLALQLAAVATTTTTTTTTTKGFTMYNSKVQEILRPELNFLYKY